MTRSVRHAAAGPATRMLVVLTGALVLIGLLVLWLEPPCAWQALTAVDCPTCGATRAARALLAGNPAEAFRHHPPTVIVTAQLGVLAAGAVVLRLAGRTLRRPPQRAIDIVLAANVLMLLVAWGGRLIGGR